ncbi:MAG: hypothetical protein AAFV43_16000 [Planctomycetota bacterium]
MSDERPAGRSFGRRAAAGLLRATALLLLGAASMGASCSPSMRTLSMGPPAPTVIGPTSTAGDIVGAINANTARVTTYQASQASFSAPGMPNLPLLGGAIAVERPHRFRLRATTRLTGPEFDAGGNENRFWFWARRNDPPGLYTADYASLGGRSLTVDPSLVIDALGLLQIDSTSPAEGPFPRGDGRVEVRTVERGRTGVRRRVIVVDAATAHPVEQQVYDGQGTLIASVEASRFVYDAPTGASVPRRVTLRLPVAGMALTIDTGTIALNAPVSGGDGLWRMPSIAGTPVVDLARTDFTVAADAGRRDPAIAEPFADGYAASDTARWEAAPIGPTTPRRQATFTSLPRGGVALPAVGSPAAR